MDHITRSVAPVVTTATTVLPAGFSPVPAPRKRNALKAKKQLEQSLLANVDGTGSRQIVADGRTVANAHAASLHFSNNHNNNSNSSSSSLSVARCRANDHHHVVDQGSPPLRGLSERLLEEAQSMPNCYQFVQQTDTRESKGNIPACPAHQTSDIRLQFEIACAALHGVRADLVKLEENDYIFDNIVTTVSRKYSILFIVIDAFTSTSSSSSSLPTSAAAATA
ncbi:conserved hypothetical protein [Trichinella spiralis]|uniref:hypothetical protein n=1 Tax=Trichinella spiralis TaxID=6334 RepID=UPI0001EFBAE8|nr:conserved hypothetical protein [Trichinella spiralis]